MNDLKNEKFIHLTFERTSEWLSPYTVIFIEMTLHWKACCLLLSIQKVVHRFPSHYYLGA